jgi:thiol-disulfide isomerase/thioredoxin
LYNKGGDKMKKIKIVLLAILLITIVGCTSVIWQKEKLYIAKFNDEIYIVNETYENEMQIADNFESSDEYKSVLTDDYLFYTDNYEDDIFTLKYKKRNEIFKNNFTLVGIEISDFEIINNNIVYFQNGTIYYDDLKENRFVVSNALFYQIENETLYILKENLVLVKIKMPSLEIIEIDKDVLNVEYIENGNIYYTKQSNEILIKDFTKNLYKNGNLINSLFVKSVILDQYYNVSLNEQVLSEYDTYESGMNKVRDINYAINDKEFSLVLVGNDTCPYCKKLLLVLDELSKMYGFEFSYIDYADLTTNEKKQVSVIYDIKYFPTLLAFENSKLINNHIGYSLSSEILLFIEANTDFTEDKIVKDVDINKYIETHKDNELLAKGQIIDEDLYEYDNNYFYKDELIGSVDEISNLSINNKSLYYEINDYLYIDNIKVLKSGKLLLDNGYIYMISNNVLYKYKDQLDEIGTISSYNLIGSDIYYEIDNKIYKNTVLTNYAGKILDSNKFYYYVNSYKKDYSTYGDIYDEFNNFVGTFDVNFGLVNLNN